MLLQAQCFKLHAQVDNDENERLFRHGDETCRRESIVRLAALATRNSSATRKLIPHTVTAVSQAEGTSCLHSDQEVHGVARPALAGEESVTAPRRTGAPQSVAPRRQIRTA